MVSLAKDLGLTLDRVGFALALGIEPDQWQARLLRSHSPRVLLNCSRQSGKSTMAAIIGLHRALYFPGSLVLMLAPALRQSQELFGKLMGFYKDLGRPVAAKTQQALSLELVNGSRMITLPGTEKTIRGFSGVDLLLVDEAARIDDELFYALRPMLAVSGGTLLMMSTPYGKRGVFFDSWKSEVERWERYTVPAGECPRITEEFLEEEREALGPFFFNQEYLCEFQDTAFSVFRSEDLEAMLSDEVQPLVPPERRFTAWKARQEQLEEEDDY